MAEKIFVGADHVGYKLKNRLVDELKKMGYEPIDVGPKQLDPADDYPDYAKPVAKAVSSGEVQRGVLTCGTGLGMSYTANRFPKVRAALAWNAPVSSRSIERVQSRASGAVGVPDPRLISTVRLLTVPVVVIPAMFTVDPGLAASVTPGSAGVSPVSVCWDQLPAFKQTT